MACLEIGGDTRNVAIEEGTGASLKRICDWGRANYSLAAVVLMLTTTIEVYKK
jgi:hypothetical protein